MTTKKEIKILQYKDLDLPIYTNTRRVLLNLDASDLVKAAVLGGLNTMLVGVPGSGKSQIASDIYNHYFGGNKKEGGKGIFIRGRNDIDIYNEIFTNINLEKASVELTNSIDALVYDVDEINRCHPVQQNQFLSLGDGVMDYKGKSINLGKNSYSLLLTTANIGNGEYQGTFGMDKALYNRLPVAIDFDHLKFMPTDADQMKIDILRDADPKVKKSETRDISDLILTANSEINEALKNPGLESLAVLNYIRYGLGNCQLNGRKEKNQWPAQCQDCEHSKGLCSKIKTESQSRRVTQSLLKYSAALSYLAKLKDKNIAINVPELMFEAFKITGAYQSLLNPTVLTQEFYENSPKMMEEIVDKLKTDYVKQEDFIISSIEGISKGKKVTEFCEHKGIPGVAIYHDLSEKAKKKVTKIEPYHDKQDTGMSWMETFIDINLQSQKEK